MWPAGGGSVTHSRVSPLLGAKVVSVAHTWVIEVYDTEDFLIEQEDTIYY